jgi:hypothetical protein
MANAHYSHRLLGFAFELPTGWGFELESASARFPAIVSLRSGQARIMVAARSPVSEAPAERVATMRKELAARGIEAAWVSDAPAFAGIGNVAAVEFALGGERQRWLSVVTDGIEFSLTHTRPYEEVRAALARIAATFHAPSPEQVRQFLAAQATTFVRPRAARASGLTEFEKVAAQFNVPLAPPRARGSFGSTSGLRARRS